MTALRRTGIRALGQIPWGAHVCLFYETRQDLIDANAAFLRCGLEDNEFCLWLVSDPIDPAQARAALAPSAPDFARHEADGRVELLSAADWYSGKGDVDLDRLMNGMREKLRTALARGFDGIRVSGSAIWLGDNRWHSFMQYEERVEQSLAGLQVLAMCVYELGASSGADLLSVAKAHDMSIARRHGNWEIIEAISVPRASGPLTDREIEVLSWAARGKSAWETGEIMAISKRTVDEYAQRAAVKLGASNRTQAVAIAVRNRLIDPAQR